MTAPATQADSAPAARRGLPRALAAQLRPKQWIKNLACLGGLVFAGKLLDPAHQMQAALGMLAFCLASSAVYVLNDLVDLERDRRNPRTARRPLAAGELPVWLACAALAACAAGAAALAWPLGSKALGALGFYFALNVAYNLRLKDEVVIDVLCIAMGFVLRLLFGIWAVQTDPTAWVALCMLFLAVFLGFSKRHAELESAGARAGEIRPVLAKYTMPYLEMLIALSAGMAVMTYAVFTVASHKNPTLVVTVLPVSYCIFRYMMQVMVRGRGGSPEDILLSDRKLWAGVGVWLLLCVFILYGDLQLFAETRAGLP